MALISGIAVYIFWYCRGNSSVQQRNNSVIDTKHLRFNYSNVPIGMSETHVRRYQSSTDASRFIFEEFRAVPGEPGKRVSVRCLYFMWSGASVREWAGNIRQIQRVSSLISSTDQQIRVRNSFQTPILINLKEKNARTVSGHLCWALSRLLSNIVNSDDKIQRGRASEKCVPSRYSRVHFEFRRQLDIQIELPYNQS